MAQPVGSSRAACCIQGGVTSMGHQQPPMAASRLAAITPGAAARVLVTGQPPLKFIE